jgi:hypothetical protein
LQRRRCLRLDRLLLPIPVNKLHEGSVASREDLYMCGVCIAPEAHPGTVFGGCDLDIRPALRIYKPKENRFRVSGGPVWHLYSWIRRQHLNFGTNAATGVNELEFTTSKYGSDRGLEFPLSSGGIARGRQDEL